MDGIPTKIRRKIHAFFTLYFKFWRLFFVIKICKIQPLDLLFLVVFIRFYISRYHFPQILKVQSALSEKKIFITNSPFLMFSLKLPKPLPFKVSEYPFKQNKNTFIKYFFFSNYKNIYIKKTNLILCLHLL